MMLIVTTEEQLQEVFDKALDKAIQKYKQLDIKPEPIIITTAELCAKLGVTEQTLIKWRQKGKVPFIRIGSSIRFELAKVIEALEVKNKSGWSK